MPLMRSAAPGRNPHVDFHGERRTNETHVAPHEPQAKLFRKGKGQPAKLYYMGHVLMEHRLGLPIDAEFTQADGFAEESDSPPISPVTLAPTNPIRDLCSSRVRTRGELQANTSRQSALSS